MSFGLGWVGFKHFSFLLLHSVNIENKTQKRRQNLEKLPTTSYHHQVTKTMEQIFIGEVK